MLSSKKALILAVLSVLSIQIYKRNLVKLLGEPDQRTHQHPSPDHFSNSVHCMTAQKMSDTSTWNNQTKLIIACTGTFSLKKFYTCLVMNALIKIAYPELHWYFSKGSASFYSSGSLQWVSLLRCALFFTSGFCLLVQLD